MIPRHWIPLVALSLLIALSLLFYHQLAFSGKILARGDTYEYFYPYWDARNAAYRAGRLPLWTPDLFMGIPLLANPQIGTYYPPNWLTAPLRAPGAISISILLHSVLAAAGACWLYREAVSKRWIPALAAGLVYAFSGQLGAHVEQINQFQGLAWLPLLVALYHRSLTRDKKARDCLLLALAWALQIFSGHTQTVFISGVGLCLYALGAAFSERRQRIKSAASALFILACSFGIARCWRCRSCCPAWNCCNCRIGAAASTWAAQPPSRSRPVCWGVPCCQVMTGSYLANTSARSASSAWGWRFGRCWENGGPTGANGSGC